MSMSSSTCESPSSSKINTHWPKLRDKIHNMLSMHHRSEPQPFQPGHSSPPPEEAVSLIRNGSARLCKSTWTRFCRSSSTCNSIHPIRLGKSFSMNQSSPPQPLPPVPSSSLPVPELPLISFSDLKREKTPMRREAGGMVYKARHIPTGRLYAVKVLDGIDLHDSVRRQIIQEFQVLREVANPNIVNCYDMFGHNDEIHVLLEYMDGGSLKGMHIKSEKNLSDFARQILTGLDFLHKRHVVHRDIKPSNIFIKSRSEVKIADFVGRVLANPLDPCYTSFGNMAYMCPERINPDLYHGKFDAYAGDIWSLGVSILEFYIGRFPFNVRSDQEDWSSLMWAISMCQPPEAPIYASRELKHFIASCLQREPKNRSSAAQLLQHPFISGNSGGRT